MPTQSIEERGLWRPTLTYFQRFQTGPNALECAGILKGKRELEKAGETKGNAAGQPANPDRKAGELTQDGCSMTGFAFQIMDLVGPDLAVVVFGERDCATAFPRITAQFASLERWNVYTVALRETDVIAGKAEGRLRDCLVAVARQLLESVDVSVTDGGVKRSPAIIVLSTCLSEMTGADPVPICETVSRETGVRIIPVATSGLKLRTQAGIVDQVAETLIGGLADFGPVDPKAVNLLGYQTDGAEDITVTDRVFRAEADRLIAAFGGRLNSTVPAGATIADWRNLPGAGLNFIVEKALMRGVVKMLDGGGHRFIELAQPKGIAASDRFYSAIAAELGVDAGPILAEFEPRRKAAAIFEEARSRFTGMRLAYGIGSVHNFRPDLLALEGLGNLPLFLELGFDVEIVIQERDYPEVHQRIKRNLEILGVDAPYSLFYEPAVLEPALRNGRFDCAYVADFMRDQVVRAGIPMLPFGDASSGYWFAGQTVRQISRTLGAVFDRRWSRYFQGAGNGAGGGR